MTLTAVQTMQVRLRADFYRHKWQNTPIELIVDDFIQEVTKNQDSFTAYDVTKFLRLIFPRGQRRIAHDTGMPTADVKPLVHRYMQPKVNAGEYVKSVKDFGGGVEAIYYEPAPVPAPDSPPQTINVPALPISGPQSVDSPVVVSQVQNVASAAPSALPAPNKTIPDLRWRHPNVVRHPDGKINLAGTLKNVVKDFDTVFGVEDVQSLLGSEYGIGANREQIRRALVAVADLDSKGLAAIKAANRPVRDGLLVRDFQRNKYYWTKGVRVKRAPVRK